MKKEDKTPIARQEFNREHTIKNYPEIRKGPVTRSELEILQNRIDKPAPAYTLPVPDHVQDTVDEKMRLSVIMDQARLQYVQEKLGEALRKDLTVKFNEQSRDRNRSIGRGY